jgi:NADH-quinone oxidoreductase subunit C
VLEVATKLRDDPRTTCDFLRCLSVVDYEDRFEVVYHLYSMEENHRFVLKASVPYDDPHVSSLISVWPGADWYEREGHDLFGVVFDGHPNLAPLILYDGFQGYPGRKSFPFNDYQEW